LWKSTNEEQENGLEWGRQFVLNGVKVEQVGRIGGKTG